MDPYTQPQRWQQPGPPPGLRSGPPPGLQSGPPQSMQYGQRPNFQSVPQSRPPPGRQPMVNGPRAFKIHKKSKLSTKEYWILDANTGQRLYEVLMYQKGRPDVQIRSLSSSQVADFGSGSFTNQARIDMVAGGRYIRMEDNRGWRHAGHHWSSPTLPGGPVLEWENKKFGSSELICFIGDKKNNPVILARLKPEAVSGIFVREVGTIFLDNPRHAIPGTQGYDELLVSAIMEMEVVNRSRQMAAAGDGGD